MLAIRFAALLALALVFCLCGLAPVAGTNAAVVGKGDNQAHGLGGGNDRSGGETIATAVPIPAIPYVDEGNTCDFFDDYDEVCPYAGSTAPDAVYSLSLPSSQLVDIDLCGSSYDTKVYVYENGPGQLHACNDDFYYDDSCGVYVSKIQQMSVNAGDTYYIVVDGYSDDCGDYILAVSQSVPGSRQWFPFDMSPPGTPADVMLDGSSSDAEMTVLEVSIHGLWMETKMHDGVFYLMPEVPGLGSVSQERIGAPDLPLLRFNVALANEAAAVEFSSAEVLEEVILDNILVWPEPIGQMDDSVTIEEVFQIDPQIYDLATFWPEGYGLASSPRDTILGFPGARTELHPFLWNPSTLELRAAKHARYQFLHGGTPQVSPETTKERRAMGERVFRNWPEIEAYFPRNVVLYQGEFLFVHPEAYATALAPLVTQKMARGFTVTALTTEQTGSTCSDIREAIQSWYENTDFWDDHYCLLVGDTDAIPLCQSGEIPTDDLYGSFLLEVDPMYSVQGDVYLGRLSVDDVEDVKRMVAKILAYEDSPIFEANYQHALLVADEQAPDAPKAYQAAMEAVMNQTYEVPPIFHPVFGSEPGNNNNDIIGFIEEGVGVAAHRGHGAWHRWVSWNGYQNFWQWDVDDLDNGLKTPVVLAINCGNSAVFVEENDDPPQHVDDCIGEAWMEHPAGGVSHYGATDRTNAWGNMLLIMAWFEAVFDKGFTRQARAIAFAENKMDGFSQTNNALKYMLLGDPDMQIHRTPPNVPTPLVPDELGVCPGGDCELPIRITDSDGLPVFDVRVGVFKLGDRDRSEPEVHANRYTDQDGWAYIPCAPQTPGWLYYAIQDDLGNSILDSILVSQDPGGVENHADQPPLQLTARSAGNGSSFYLDFGRALDGPARLRIHDVSGRVVRSFEISAGTSEVLWNGKNQGGRQVATGIYFARLSQGDIKLRTRLVLVR